MMNKRQQMYWLWGAAIIVIVALLFFRDKVSNVLYQSDNSTVTIPPVGAITLPTFERQAITIPGLTITNQTEQLSAIGACCSDCTEKKQVSAYVQPVNPLTIVFNQGNKGPNVYNYTQQLTTPWRPPYAY